MIAESCRKAFAERPFDNYLPYFTTLFYYLLSRANSGQ
jgi:hypothetical protein